MKPKAGATSTEFVATTGTSVVAVFEAISSGESLQWPKAAVLISIVLSSCIYTLARSWVKVREP